MHFEKGHIYHIFNRSNETVYYTDDNYIFFLRKLMQYIFPNSNILCWCLMPNHFHFIIQANDQSVKYIEEKNRPALQLLSKNFGRLTSSYTQALNKVRGRKGRLFSHPTEAKAITHMGNDYIGNCFHYIHQNPLASGLSTKLEHWKYSSFLDYAGLRNGKLCNKNLAFEIINFNKENFIEQSYTIIDEKFLPQF